MAAPNRLPSQWSNLLGPSPLVLFCVCQLLLILVLPGSLAIRLYTTREKAMAVFGSSNETRLYFDSCEQSSQTASCVFAIDSSVNQEPTQCAVTDPEDGPWWQAVLETPAYVTKVTVLNMDHGYRSFQDALTKMVVMAGDEICFRFESGEKFSKRSFPCDSVTDQITIKSHKKSAVLTICDVEVYGVALKFPTSIGKSQKLNPSTCWMSSDADDASSCVNAVDDQRSTNHGASHCAVTTVEEKPWIKVTLIRPSIVNDVLIYSRTDVTNDALTQFDITLNERLCAEYDGPIFESGAFKCQYFGDRLRVQSKLGNVALSVCEIQMLGHAAFMEERQLFKELGCHKDKLHDHDLSQLVGSISMSHEKCYKMCKRLGLKYFAVQDGMHCFCGNSYGKHGAAGNFSCSVGCDAEPGELCGGVMLNSVFEIL